jgi:hypothetical protein
MSAVRFVGRGFGGAGHKWDLKSYLFGRYQVEVYKCHCSKIFVARAPAATCSTFDKRNAKEQLDCCF